MLRKKTTGRPKGPGFMLEIIRHRKWWFTLSTLMIIPGVISLALFGLRLGIDFTGGSLLQVKTPASISQDQIHTALTPTIGESIIQSTGDNAYQIRTKELSPQQRNEALASLQKISPEITEERFETVGPTIGADITRKAILSVVVGSILIACYIAYAFRNVPKPASSWRFGIATIVTLLHDVLFALGFFSLLGKFAGVEVEASFVAAVLTVIGFSVHDTIVVFDRIRENLLRGQGTTLEDTVNFSIVQTLVRSINTSFTVLLVLSAMFLFGGESISSFVLALLVGIGMGTYSSIFNAAPVLVTWQKWSEKRAAKAAANA